MQPHPAPLGDGEGYNSRNDGEVEGNGFRSVLPSSLPSENCSATGTVIAFKKKAEEVAGGYVGEGDRCACFAGLDSRT
jgi:hypothetical protein